MSLRIPSHPATHSLLPHPKHDTAAAFTLRRASSCIGFSFEAPKKVAAGST